MATYVVTYDLNDEDNRPNITKHLKDGYGTWAKLSESSYAISTTDEPSTVYDYMLPMLDSNDALYVITLKRPYFGQGSEAVNDWLSDELTW
jgi:hypothetical protein